MDFNDYTTDQQNQMANLVAFVKETSKEIMGHEVDFIAVLHKTHGQGNGPCTGALVLTEAPPRIAVGMILNAAKMIVNNVEGDTKIDVKPSYETTH